MKDRLWIGCVLLVAVGCDSEPTSTPTPPPNGRWQALPGVYKDSAPDNPSCVLPEEDWRGYEPSLDAWVSASESIFVGTLAAVTKVEAPAIHWHTVCSPELCETSDIGFIEKDDCPGVFSYAIRFDFVDVETIHGHPMEETLSIQIGRLESHVLKGVYFPEGQTQLLDANNEEVYPVGARIGATVFTRSDGSVGWWFRQFQVHEGNVYLEEINHNDFVCHEYPHVIGIPDEFEGSPYNEFVAAIERAATSPNMSTEIIQNRDRMMQGFPAHLADPATLVGYQPHCSTMDPFDQDPSVPNDTNL